MEPMSSYRLPGKFATKHVSDTRIEACSREILRLPDSASRDAEISVVLQVLFENDFVPSTIADAAIRQCFQTFDDLSNPQAAAVISTFIEERLKIRIEAFASVFFKLSVKERCSDWQELARQCNGFPALELRLAQLSRGLKSEAGADRLDLIEIGAIGARVQQLFVASRSYRIYLLNQWQQTNAPDHAEHVMLLRKFHPTIAAVEPSFLSNLESQQIRSQRRYENRWRRSQSWRANQRPVPTNESSNAGPGVIIAMVIVGIIIGLLRSADLDNKQTANRSSRTLPFSPPQSLESDGYFWLERAEGESEIDTLERLAKKDPTNTHLCFQFAKRVLKTSGFQIGSSGHVMSIRQLDPAEVELLLVRVCRVLQDLVANNPIDQNDALVFYDASSQYREKAISVAGDSQETDPSPLTTSTFPVPGRDDLHREFNRYFTELADLHLRRSRPADALATLIAQRRLNQNDPHGLVYVAAHLARILGTTEISSTSHELAESFAGETIGTLMVAMNNGFADRDCLRKAMDFDSVRNRPEFEVLLQEPAAISEGMKQ